MIRVLVAEDMRILRDMLVSMLNLEDDIKVVAQVADGTGVARSGESCARRQRSSQRAV